MPIHTITGGGGLKLAVHEYGQSQGKRQDAYDLLEPLYGWFTEGFDTADLREAKTLLARIIHERSWRGRQMCVRSGRTQQ